MSRFIQGSCIHIIFGFPDNAIDFILTDPLYLAGFRNCQGRTIIDDETDEWLQPTCHEMHHVLGKDALLISLYGQGRVDYFMTAQKSTGFNIVGHLVFTKTCASKAAYMGRHHEYAHTLVKSRPRLP